MKNSDGTELITGLYAALLVSVALILAPYLVVSTFSGAIYLCLVLYAYMMRMEQEQDSPRAVHATYVIRTFWISNLVFLVSMLAVIGLLATMIYNGLLDISALRACSGGDAGPCLPLFISDNSLSFSVASFVALLPAILYLLYRFARGLARARGGAASVL
ncbi:MAG: hypothetical protein KDI90_05695 [Alphaproteobacteria bacterium]|nr:hypothetical protein [Alphaproteobacteria bacterium]MCB9974318.1 hypothetical protein [Rhodospirillales bacterium]